MGVGFGLMYYPAIVIVTMIFEKENLSMATGIAVCDAGVGTVVFAEALIKIFRRTVFAVYAGIMNTIGRILVGLISDRKLPCKYGKDRAQNRLWTYVSSLSLCDLLTAGILFCDGYITLVMYSGLFGLTLSSYVYFTSVLLVDLIGIEKLTNAFGLILLFQVLVLL
uniref:Major facilitator superfamily (MFS) profile domain-containing protein n=2 Tax=Wuchereria bancrofti TaxID=6293 RepID=A0AAF5RTM5_WUCBA